MNGPFKVWRGNPSDPGDGRDLISTIMACYQFCRIELRHGCGLGPLLAHLSAANPVDGADPILAPAENFPPIRSSTSSRRSRPASGRSHTSDPTHMETTIRTLPPAPARSTSAQGRRFRSTTPQAPRSGCSEVISHELVSSITCPCVCEPKTRWRNNKTDLDVGIPRAEPACSTTWSAASSRRWRRTGPELHDVPGDRDRWVAAHRLPDDSGPQHLHWLLSRDGAFSQANGTWNSCPAIRPERRSGSRGSPIIDSMIGRVSLLPAGRLPSLCGGCPFRRASRFGRRSRRDPSASGGGEVAQPRLRRRFLHLGRG